jgi:hypothetical protein
MSWGTHNRTSWAPTKSRGGGRGGVKKRQAGRANPLYRLRYSIRQLIGLNDVCGTRVPRQIWDPTKKIVTRVSIGKDILRQRIVHQRRAAQLPSPAAAAAGGTGVSDVASAVATPTSVWGSVPHLGVAKRRRQHRAAPRRPGTPNDAAPKTINRHHKI